jgi:hypothetical protein
LKELKEEVMNRIVACDVICHHPRSELNDSRVDMYLVGTSASRDALEARKMFTPPCRLSPGNGIAPGQKFVKTGTDEGIHHKKCSHSSSVATQGWHKPTRIGIAKYVHGEVARCRRRGRLGAGLEKYRVLTQIGTVKQVQGGGFQVKYVTIPA